MNTTLITIVLTSAVVIGGVVYLLRHYLFNTRRTADFDGGVVSQSWLVEHRAGKGDDRFS